MDFGRLLQAVPDATEIAQAVEAAVAAGDLVRRLRDRRNMTQSTLARRAGTTQAHLSEIERGVGRNGPTVGTLSRILRELDDRLVVQSQAERAEGLAADVTPGALVDLPVEPGAPLWFAVKAAEVAIHPAGRTP